jgi:hypothetical protein
MTAPRWSAAALIMESPSIKLSKTFKSTLIATTNNVELKGQPWRTPASAVYVYCTVPSTL